MNLEELDLDIRTFNAVKRAGIQTVEELRERLANDRPGLQRSIGFNHTKSAEDALLRRCEPEDICCPVQPCILSIESDCFAQMRQKFDEMLQRTLASMIRRESDEAALTLKLHLRLDHTSDELQRAVIRPDITHKITSAITVKDDLSGKVPGDYELMYDAGSERYLLRELPPDGGQMPLF